MSQKPFVLAIEPDGRQASALKRMMRDAVHGELLLVDSKDAALAALQTRIPDLLLVSALLSPRDEADLLDRLRSLEGAGHLQTLTIPQLAAPPRETRRQRQPKLLGALRRKPARSAEQGCDPSVFGEEIRTYLAQAREQRESALAAQVVEEEPDPPQADAADEETAQVIVSPSFDEPVTPPALDFIFEPGSEAAAQDTPPDPVAASSAEVSKPVAASSAELTDPEPVFAPAPAHDPEPELLSAAASLVQATAAEAAHDAEFDAASMSTEPPAMELMPAQTPALPPPPVFFDREDRELDTWTEPQPPPSVGESNAPALSLSPPEPLRTRNLSRQVKFLGSRVNYSGPRPRWAEGPLDLARGDPEPAEGSTELAPSESTEPAQIESSGPPVNESAPPSSSEHSPSVDADLVAPDDLVPLQPVVSQLVALRDIEDEARLEGRPVEPEEVPVIDVEPAEVQEPDTPAPEETVWLAQALDTLLVEIQRTRSTGSGQLLNEERGTRNAEQGTAEQVRKPERRSQKARRVRNAERGTRNAERTRNEEGRTGDQPATPIDEVMGKKSSSFRVPPSAFHGVPQSALHIPRSSMDPLSMWARSEYDVEEPARPRRRDELQELLAGLNVPLAVAAVTYASGCRVRRVRVRRRAHEKDGPSTGSGQGERPPVVILSRRTLEELRQAAAKEKEQRPAVRSLRSDVPRRPDADASQQLHAARI